MVNFQIIKKKDMEYIYIQMVVDMKVCGKAKKKMEKEYYIMQMVIDMKEIGLIIYK